MVKEIRKIEIELADNGFILKELPTEKTTLFTSWLELTHYLATNIDLMWVHVGDDKVINDWLLERTKRRD